MRKLTIILLLTFICSYAISQSIYTAIQLNQEREYKTKKPKKIVETNTFYNTNGVQTNKNIKTFDEAGMLLTEERYDENGERTARLIYSNDTVNRLTLSRSFERWSKFGYSKETAYYEYDTNNFLVSMTDKNANDQITFVSKVLCNAKGDPIELLLFDGNGNPYGKEIATYYYDKNLVTTSVISNIGQTLSNSTRKINYEKAYLFPSNSEVYNDKGDLIIVRGINSNGDAIEKISEEEYVYDGYGNCTENKSYKVTVKKNGKEIRKIERIFKKQYTY